MSEHTGGYSGAGETLARRYGMNYAELCRIGPQVMLKLARFAKRQEKLEQAPRPTRIGGAVNG